MAEPEASEEEGAKKRSKKPLILGGVLALLLGAGGFFATYTGLVGGHEAHAKAKEEAPAIAFVPIQPLVIPLGPQANARHLRFTGDREVAAGGEGEVLHLMPRILDVLNSYLRAVEIGDFNDPPALARLRAQMLRRVQIVTGEGKVRDLLITEFVLN